MSVPDSNGEVLLYLDAISIPIPDASLFGCRAGAILGVCRADEF